MTTTATGGLTIECAKPDCSWRGSPADAPNHPCPTPAPDATNEEKADAAAARGAKLPQTTSSFLDGPSGSTPSNEGTKPEPAPLTVEETEKEMAEFADLEARLTAAGVTYSPDLGLEELRGLAQLLVDDPAPREPSLGEPIASNSASESASTTVDDDQATAAEVVHQEPALADPRPWQTVIAQAVNEQGSVTAYKWLAVAIHTDSQPAALLGRGKTKNEATVIAEDSTARATIQGEIVVVKTADVLKAADEILTRKETPDAPPAQEEEGAGVEKAPLAAPTEADTPDTTPDTGATLFDVGDYDDPSLALPGVDGRGIERIAVAFTGEVMLDRASVADVALFKRLKLGQTVELWVEARGLGFAAKGATNKDGELDVVVAKRTVTVQHLRVLGAEDLAEAALEIASQARDAEEAQDARDRRPDDA